MRTILIGAALACPLFAQHSSPPRGVHSSGGALGFRTPSFRRTDSVHRPVSGFPPWREAYTTSGISSWASAPYDGLQERTGYNDEIRGPQIIFPALAPNFIPPAPVSSVTHEYNWPAPANDAAKVFSLVSSSATVQFAIAVWVQGDVLHYIAPDLSLGRTALDAIDREATRRLNAQSGLNLWLPAGTQSR